ncbi:MAG: S1/P1 nuclease [Bacteroidota bacterium]|nr:S1/P1 nuclease [Bacteroidota bacterium]
MKKLIYILLFSCILLPSSIYAWGAKGHKIIAAIAKQSLNKQIVDSVQKYLGVMSFEEASVWMDEVRSKKEFDYLKTWHYVNVEKDKTYVKTKDPEVVNEIEIAIATLKEKGIRDKEKINFALKIIFHLIGDIHQPLHCGYAHDKGGNTIKVTYINKETNLHKVWDSEIIEDVGITLNDCLKLANALSLNEKNKIQTNNVEVWMNESRALLPEVYNFDEKIKQDYIDKNKPVIEKQLVKAGIRLANVLHDTFKK